MRSPVVSFRESPLLDSELSRRGSDSARHLIAKRDLERYYQLLRRVRDTGPGFTQVQWDVLCAACKSVVPFSDETLPLVWAYVDTYYAEHPPRDQEFVDKLRDMPLVQKIVVADMIERLPLIRSARKLIEFSEEGSKEGTDLGGTSRCEAGHDPLRRDGG